MELCVFVLYVLTSHNVVGAVKSRNMKWAGHVAYVSFLDQMRECLYDNSVGGDKIMVPNIVL
jgi:hypothetical protein